MHAAVDAAVEAVRPGGRVVLAGIPSDERTSFKASTARRKGLTIVTGAAHEAHLPARDRARGGRPGRPALGGHPPLPARGGAAAFEVAARREGLKVLVQRSSDVL